MVVRGLALLVMFASMLGIREIWEEAHTVTGIILIILFLGSIVVILNYEGDE